MGEGARGETGGVEIDPAAARALAVLAGFPDRPQSNGRTGDVKRLRGEVDRLLLYALGQKKIAHGRRARGRRARRRCRTTGR